MDILIKNIGLPTEDEQVNITILSDGSVIEHFRTEKGRWTSYRSGGVKAIEVPPHGRLGDLDALSETIDYSAFWDSSDLSLARDIVNDAPIVIEASNGSDN